MYKCKYKTYILIYFYYPYFSLILIVIHGLKLVHTDLKPENILLVDNTADSHHDVIETHSTK